MVAMETKGWLCSALLLHPVAVLIWGKYGGCVEGLCSVQLPQLNTYLLYSTLCLK